MNEPSHPLKSLVLDVVDLCEQTLALAGSGRPDPSGIAPVREAAEAVWRELDALEASWDAEQLARVLPSEESAHEDGGGDEPSNEWLFGSDDELAAEEHWSEAER